MATTAVQSAPEQEHNEQHSAPLRADVEKQKCEQRGREHGDGVEREVEAHAGGQCRTDNTHSHDEEERRGAQHATKAMALSSAAATATKPEANDHISGGAPLRRSTRWRCDAEHANRREHSESHQRRLKCSAEVQS
jgi:hypothetical protein